MTSSLRWGILGTGAIATMFTRDLLENGFTVSAVGSRTAESARRFASEHGIPTAHPSYEALAADPEVDVVYVSTPHPMHAAGARLALEGGKHVLVEKSFTLNAREAEQIVGLADERGLVILEAMWTRWLPHMVRLRQILAAGLIGEVRTVIADHSQHLAENLSGRIYNPALGGGALLDLGIYPVSFAWDVFGEPTSIAATASPTVTGVDRQTAIVLGYAQGQQAVLTAGLDTAGPNRAAILGTAGWVELASVWYAPTALTVYDNARSIVERFDQPVSSRGMQYEAWELERRVASGPSPNDILPPAESVAIMRTLDEIRRQIGLSYPGESAGQPG